MKRLLLLLLVILSCFVVGVVINYVQADSIATWYPLLNKSPLSPPQWVFPMVWNILYMCMGLSIGLIVCRKNPRELYFIGIFTAQMILNLLWSICFFYLQKPMLGLIVIVLLIAVIVYYLAQSYRWANRLSFSLFIPYLLWMLFEGYLNLYIAINN